MIVVLILLCSEFVDHLCMIKICKSRSKRRTSFQQTRSKESLKLLRFNKIAIQARAQIAADKETVVLLRVHMHGYKVYPALTR